MVTPGYGLSQSVDGRVFEWNFRCWAPTWTAADSIVQDILKKEKGSLKGKKIALVYHDSPYGKEPIPLLQKRAAKEGFELSLLPVTAPGVERKSHLAANPPRPPRLRDSVVCRCDDATAIREAQATGFPREMYAIWWGGC